VALSGDASDSVLTDGSGNYSFTDLDSGSYTVTPTKDDYTFTPASDEIVISGSGDTSDFVGAEITSYYVDGGWEDESALDYGSAPTNAWVISGSSKAIDSVANVACPTLDGYTPSQGRCQKFISSAGIGGTDIWRINWLGLRNASESFDVTNGFRVQALLGTSPSGDAGSVLRWDLYVTNSANDHTVSAGISLSNGGGDLAWAREQRTSPAYDAETDAAITVAQQTDNRWWVLGLEMPAGGTGNLKSRIGLPGEVNTQDITKVLSTSFAAETLDEIKILGLWQNCVPHIAWVWTGALTDDWPI